jgi:hypothetical protein
MPQKAEAPGEMTTGARSSALSPPAATKDGSAMNSRKYRAGQTVTMTPNRARATPKGRFEVVRLMPAEHGTYQYRIRSVMDGHERVVQESELD